MILLAVVLIIGITVGLSAVIILVGHFATVKARLDHEQKMVRLGEEMKMNAVTLRERDVAIQEAHMRVLNRSSDVR